MTVAQFFYQIYTDVFEILLNTDTNHVGILKLMLNYFDIVKINEREMLHLYFLIWLTSNLKFTNLQDQLQMNSVFADHMICYLNSVIKCSVNLTVKNLEIFRKRLHSSLVKNSETNKIFIFWLHCDSNAVVFKHQMHSKKHSHTCFKYI